MRLLFRVVLAASLIVSSACDGGGITSGADGTGTGGDARSGDGVVSGDGADHDGPKKGSCPAVPCAKGYFCYNGTCVLDHGPCKGADDDCINDSFCHQGHCVPFGPATKKHDPNCKNEGFKAEQLKAPVVKCSWTKAGVRMSPMVADIDGDKQPEIVFNTQQGMLTAIRGKDCKEVFSVKGAYAQGSNPAIADVTGDKVPEIVMVDKTNRIVVHDNKGKVVAKSPAASKVAYKETSGGPAIANLDGKGLPEIVHGGMAVRFQGGTLTTLYNVTTYGGYRGVFSAVADVDLDGKPEIVAGNRILDGLTGKDETPAAVKKMPGGHVAIAQFDPSTPEPEIVLVTSHSTKVSTVRIFHPVTGKVIFGPYNFGQRMGGPPTVADFDGDKKPEVAAAGYVGYAVFDPQCAAKPLPSFCHSPGMRWFKVTQDKSSGCTGSSVFDFNGDGKAEVVYRDECWLRVYDGTTGKVLFAHSISSGTKMELPVVADVDNDNHADIVVSSDSYTKCSAEKDLGLKHKGATKGIFVLQDPKNLWMPSRSIWNQHTYHITNVNDDVTVPAVEKHNWLTWNNYRQNTQGMLKKAIPAPDLTGKQAGTIDPSSDCKQKWVLQAQICNRGAVKAPAGVKGTFYKWKPGAGGTKICTTATTKALAPGQCEAVKCTYPNPPTDPIDLWFKADDDGTGGGQVECKEKNNLLHFPKAKCKGGKIE